MLYRNVTDLIGNTPLVALTHLETRAKIFGKLESQNPAGSAKDRAALYMLLDAEEKGLLTPGGTVIEPTSGNTGISLAMLCSLRGYKCIIVMPDSMSVERQKLMTAYGAELVLTPGKLGMQGAIDKAEELQKEIPGSFIPDQFNNPANAKAHFETTGPEIWNDVDGKVDIFVAGVGTGGSVTGTGAYLKSQNPQVKIIAVEPAESPLLTRGTAGAHGIQGIGANFVPGVLNRNVCDEIMTVATEAAFEAARLLAQKEGLLAGISAGAALQAAMELANREENAGKHIVVLLPDTGLRYLSTELFEG